VKKLGKLTKVYVGLVVFSLVGMLATRTAGLDPGLIPTIASALTLLVGVAAVFVPVVQRRSQWGAVLIVLVLGALVEFIGVATGVPFGRYRYTDRWQPQILLGDIRFPLLVPFAWLLVAGASYLFALKALRELTPPRNEIDERPAVFLGAVISSLVDLPMEWAMTGSLGYWTWISKGPLPGGAPWTNLLGWLATSAIACVVFQRADIGATTHRGQPEAGVDAAVVLLGHLALTLGIGLIGLV
jgi:putative membrane protein